MQFRLSPGNIYCEVPLNPEFPVYTMWHRQEIDQPDRLHYHGCAELGFCVSGSGLFFIGNKTFTYSEGDIIVINPYCPHIAHTPYDSSSIWQFISVDLPAFNLSCRTGSRLFRDDDCKELLRLAFNEANGRSPDRRDVFTLLLRAFLMKSARIPGDTADSGDAAVIAPALDLIYGKYASSISVTDMADACHVSESCFRRAFRKYTGKAPQEYLTDMRMQTASVLLRSTDIPISGIAGEVGYDSLSSFNRQFMRSFGIQPRKLRSSTQDGENEEG